MHEVQTEPQIPLINTEAKKSNKIMYTISSSSERAASKTHPK